MCTFKILIFESPVFDFEKSLDLPDGAFGQVEHFGSVVFDASFDKS